MKVKQLLLKNIRSFGNLNINFSPSINLLIGHNNSGKSTIIKALYKLQNTYSLAETDVRKLKKYGRILIHIDEINKTELRVISESVVESGKRDLSTNEVRFLFNLFDSRDEKKIKFENLLLDGNIEFKGENAAIEGTLYEFKGLPNYENESNFIFPFFAKRKTNNYNTRINAKEAYHISEDLSNITAKIARLSNNSHPKNARFVKVTESILGFKVGVLPFREDQTTGIFINDSESIPIHSMGEGVVNILGLIVNLFTDDRKLYLIEELENDIHPKALKQLLQLIVEKSKNNQFVISTHSNIVLKHLGIGGSKIFRLEWKPFEKSTSDRLPTTTVIEVDDSPMQKLSLLEYLGYELYDFDLYSSYIIFEESSAEVIVREFLIPSFFPLLKSKVRTIAASGVDDIEARLSDFLRLFVFIHTTPIYNSKAWVIADGDDAGKRVTHELERIFPTWDKKHFYNLSKKNIEEYYPLRFKEQVEIALIEKNKTKKRELKKQVLYDVLYWCEKNHDIAKREFSESAKEIINWLSKMQKIINK